MLNPRRLLLRWIRAVGIVGVIGVLVAATLLVTASSAAADVATTTSVSTSGSPSLTGSAVTFTANVTSGEALVNAGSVSFSADGVSLGPPVPVSPDGTASFTTSALAEGTHNVVAAYDGALGFLPSNGSLTQVVDNETTVSGNMFCNAGPLSIPAAGPATPYGSHITVSGLPGAVTKVTAHLTGLSHGVPADLDLMLVGPSGANVVLLSDAGGTEPIADVNLSFDDAALAGVPADSLPSGSYRPTNDDTEGADAFPAPAPALAGTTMGAFNNVSGNGVWTLYAYVDATGDAGSISGGWCLTIESVAATTTTVTSSANPSANGQDVTFTADVQSEGNPVATGTVTFTIDGVQEAPVAVDASGQATFTTSGLAPGSHSVTAAYDGTATFAASSGGLTQVVLPPQATTTVVTSLPDPATEGDPVTIEAVVSGGSATIDGTVQFYVDGSAFGAPVPVDAGGIATLTTAGIEVGDHSIGAAYSGNSSSLASSGGTTQVVLPRAGAGGPYVVAEGGLLTLDATGSSDSAGTTYAWDLNGDGDFADATGISPTLGWAELEALGINDGPYAGVATVRVTLNGTSATGDAELSVTNVAPLVTVDGPTAATVGVPITLKVGAVDPSSADAAGLFTYTVDWGDGSPIESVVGPADPPVTHNYANVGIYTATFTATDKDGASAGGFAVTMTVAAPPTPPRMTGKTTNRPSAAPGKKGTVAYTGVDLAVPGVIALALLGIGGLILTAARRRQS